MGEQVNLFSFLINNLCKRADFEFLKYVRQFGSLKTNLDRVNFVYDDLLKFPNFIPFQKNEKNDGLAVLKRESGNDHFKEKNYRQALDSYTASILTAKSDLVLALAYANRSAALSHLNLHTECLVDIERALEHGYPDHLKPKLVKRQNHCKAQTIFKEKYYEAIPSFPDSEKNPSIEAARNCVKLTREEQYGRCVMASRNIEIGEIISIEKPYSAVLKDQIYVHCHECFELCYHLIPCNSCTKALYCGIGCKEKAFATYHRYECPILLTLDSLALDPPKYLALKILFMSRDELNMDTDEDQEVYRSHRFKEIYNLEGHLQKRVAADLLARSAYAAGFFHLIKNHTTFLEGDVNEDRLKEILLSIILICGINTVDINELTPCMSHENRPIAVGIYSFFTMFNHSCWPNTMGHYHGSTMVLRAINTIKTGEQCFVMYGPNYTKYPKTLRQTFLASHQFFTCTCRACEENWPTGSNVKNMPLDLSLIMMKLFTADVGTAKEELRYLLVKAKTVEGMLPPGQDYFYKEVLMHCYNIFGNKRKI